MSGRRNAGVSFLLVTLSLDKQRKVTRPLADESFAPETKTWQTIRCAQEDKNKSHPHPLYTPLLRRALRAGFAVRFGILPSQSAPSPA